jgi:hypothetical protein
MCITSLLHFERGRRTSNPDAEASNPLACSQEQRVSYMYNTRYSFFCSQLEKEKAAQAMAAGQAPKEGDVDLLSFDDADLALATFDALIDDVSRWFRIWGRGARFGDECIA